MKKKIKKCTQMKVLHRLSVVYLFQETKSKMKKVSSLLLRWTLFIFNKKGCFYINCIINCSLSYTNVI